MAKLKFDMVAFLQMMAKCEKEVILVKDEGIYCISDNHDPKKDKPVYAIGYDPHKADVYDKCRAAVGGDDFGEHLGLAGFNNLLRPETTGFAIVVTAKRIVIEAYAK